MLRFLVPLVLVSAILATVWLSADPSRPRADFTFINRGSINILDPAVMSYMQDIRIARSVWEGLTATDPKTAEPIEGVAYLPPQISEDRLTYVFTLRPEAKWANGDPVTAADFVRGWRRAIEPGTADVYAELIISHIAGATHYVRWRTEVVEVLGLVRQYQKGTASNGARPAMLATPTGIELLNLLGVAVPDPAPPADDPFWQQAAQRLGTLSVDWKRVGDDLLDRHIARMDAEFAKVGIRARDDRHLEVRLAHPTAFFLDLTAFSTYLPVHESIEILRNRYEGRPLEESGTWSYDPQWTKPDYHRLGYPGLIGNGPLMLKQWDFKRRMLLVRNPNYWNQAAIKSETIEMVDSEYQNTAFMLYERGAADMMTDLSMDYTADLVQMQKRGQRNDIRVMPAFGSYYLSLNCAPTLPDGRPNPLADPRVRRALTRAVNKREICEYVTRKGETPSNCLVPPNQLPGYVSPAGLSHDPELARKELAEAGYPGGKGIPRLEYLYNTGFGHELIAQAVGRMWRQELGIDISLVGKETKTFAEDKSKGRFTISRANWFGDYNDPTTFLDLWHSDNGHNSGGFKDPKFDAMLAAAAVELDEQKRLQILSEAERYLVEDQLPDIPIYTYVSVYAWRPQVKGIYPNPRLMFPLHHIYVEDE